MTFQDGEFTLWTSEIYEDSSSTINIVFRVRANIAAAHEAKKRGLSIIGLRMATPDEISIWLSEHPDFKPIT